jgi:hypothetical protein
MGLPSLLFAEFDSCCNLYLGLQQTLGRATLGVFKVNVLLFARVQRLHKAETATKITYLASHGMQSSGSHSWPLTIHGHSPSSQIYSLSALSTWHRQPTLLLQPSKSSTLQLVTRKDRRLTIWGTPTITVAVGLCVVTIAAVSGLASSRVFTQPLIIPT